MSCPHKKPHDPEELIEVFKKAGYMVLFAMFLIVLVRIVDGKEHRLGTFRLATLTDITQTV